MIQIEDGKDHIIVFLGIVGIVALIGSVCLTVFVMIPENAKAQKIKEVYLANGCYVDDNLPVIKFKTWYEKDGWICEQNI